ncbi:phage tail sheath subtilisin-like domain-containing protein [Variovorax sp. VNK109]|uniref:phage tail sheath subtilisin-like domain-containing protein n=1 Tax=Variovorax sp. VNK109 TaxID=3400919 RepID=UPI003BFAE094
MPDNITFNTLPIDIRTPGQYIEIDNSKALRGLPNMNRRMLFIGNKLAAGTAAGGALQRINSAAEAATLFGRGSVLHEMLKFARDANKTSDIWAIGLDDLGGGVAQVQTITVTVTTAQAGTISLYVNGQKLSVGVSAGDAVATIATAIAAAINAYLDGPVTATSAAGVVTVTARHKGQFTADIDLRVNYYSDEKTPTGVTLVVAAGAAGAGNPDVATALAAINSESFYSIVTPYNDAANLTKLETEFNSRWGGMDMRTGHVFYGFKGTQGQITTHGSARNSPHSSFIGVKNPPQAPYIWASVFAAVVEFNGAIDPARPFQTVALPGLLPPAQADRYTRLERDLNLRDGCSTFTVDQGGNVLIERVVTTYQVNAYGLDDVSYLDLETKWTVDYMRFAFRAAIAFNFPRHKLADDGTNFAPGQAVATPSTIKSVLLATARQLEEVGLLENFAQFKTDLIVVRSTSDRNRVNAILPPDVVNQFRVFAASVQFIL